MAQLIVQRLEDGQLDGDAGLEAIAAQFELSSRQIRRIVQKELGVPPIQLLLTRRLLLAKQLLTETHAPDHGGRLRQRLLEPAPVQRRVHAAATACRRRGCAAGRPTAPSGLATAARPRCSWPYRPPYDWAGMLAFLAARALTGIERVTGTTYARTVELGNAKGWIRGHAEPEEARADSRVHAHAHARAAGAAAPRAGALRSQRAARRDRGAPGEGRAAGRAVKANPGLRVPGAFNGFEMGMRAILGQQVTVKAATTIACRFVDAFGEPIVTPFAELNRLTPSPARVADARSTPSPVTGSSRRAAGSIIALAEAQASGALCLDGGVHGIPTTSIQRLAELPGIGQWTAHYIAMRALRWPDAFPEGRHRGAEAARRRDREGGRGAVAGVAAVAQLRRDAPLGHGGVGRVETRTTDPAGPDPLSRAITLGRLGSRTSA